MISHVTIGVGDLASAAEFYAAVLAPMGIHQVHHDEHYVGFAKGLNALGRPNKPVLWICHPFDGLPAHPGNGWHVAFEADSAQSVLQSHRIALQRGGQCEGAPGRREHYHPAYFGGFFRDLDQNKIQICCHTHF
jgi:catechol 2,3-dioxygenase-like lactoylglutathione lyase family enzyme